jgi:hypothetical protein
MDPATDVGMTGRGEEYLPFGVYGPPKYKDFNFLSSSAANWTEGNDAFAWGGYNNKIFNHGVALAVGRQRNSTAGTETSAGVGEGVKHGLPVSNARFKFTFPRVQTRASASQDNLNSPSQAFFGAWTGKTKTDSKFNLNIKDLLRTNAQGLNSQFDVDSTYTEYMWKFSLDEVRATGSDTEFIWEEGLHKGLPRNDSEPTYRAVTSEVSGSSYKDILDKDIDSFTTVFHGGSDGLDITEIEPFRNTLLAGKTETTNYAFNTIKEAIDSIADPEFVEYNLVTIPGLTNEGLTTHLLETVEARADALAIIDLKGDFQPAHEKSDAKKEYGSVTTTINNLKDRGLNSSYGCAYYPWVQIRDTIRGNLIYMPPSVAAIGAMSFTDRVRAPWFAPAGFNRGGLSTGVAGLPVVNVTERLVSKDRDKLYDANINPIATFPNEGIVIFGQKTLQVTRSALDRINVRRLMLFVKKGISAIASNILFEPNMRETWSRFIAQAEPFLADVKARFGLDDYKLVLDETTTTADLIDRNVLYAKVFLKPARAIEFIAVDFIITNTGAAFED